MHKIIASLILILLLPVLTSILMLSIAFQGFPVFYKQSRIGKYKKKFTIYKIRTMQNAIPTKFGKILRNTGIDELPQLFNIIKGDMKFIGPRPLTQADIERLEWNTPYHDIRWAVKPGLTGLAQLAPICHKKISWFLDAYYSRNKSLKIDAIIIIRTTLAMLIGKQRVIKLIYRKSPKRKPTQL